MFKQTSQQTPDEGSIPRKKAIVQPILLDDSFPRPRIAAADPVSCSRQLTNSGSQHKFTSVAYNERTTYPCSTLSFSDIAEGSIPQQVVDITTGTSDSLQPTTGEEQENMVAFEMVVCSFALHLIETPSEIFALLWELSLKARWLVILAPHKRPEVNISLCTDVGKTNILPRSRMDGAGPNGMSTNGRPVKWASPKERFCTKGLFLCPTLCKVFTEI